MRFLKIFSKKHPPELKECYKFKGHTFYEFDNLKAIPYKRAIFAESSMRAASMCMTWQTLNDALDAQMAFMNKGDYVRAATITYEMKVRILNTADEKTLKDLALKFFTIDNEPFNIVSPKHDALKLKIWEENPDVAAFFLQKAWNHLRISTDTSQIDIPKYLMENQEKLKMLERLIQDNSSAQSTVSSTT